MYGKKTWGGPVDPFILLKFMKQEKAEDSLVSMIIFEWRDRNLVGVPIADGYGNVSCLDPQPIDTLSFVTRVSRLTTICAEPRDLHRYIYQGWQVQQEEQGPIYPGQKRDRPGQEPYCNTGYRSQRP